MSQAKYDVLRVFEPQLVKLVAAHEEKRRHRWMPNDLLYPAGCDVRERCLELQDIAARMPAPERVVYALNLLTEEGLPSYFHLLASYLDLESPFGQWIGIWTAEEDRHGVVLGGLARMSGLFPNLSALEHLQFAYLRAGFRPQWQNDPYQLLAYTSVQEQATQLSHARLAARLKQVGGGAFVLVLGNVAAEEGFHGNLYATGVHHIFSCDRDAMLCSLWEAVRNFSMPGKSLPGFSDLAKVAMRLGIFDPADLEEILRKLLVRWKVEDMSPQTPEAVAAKQNLFRLLGALRRKAQNVRNELPRAYSFDFLGGDTFVI